MLTRELIATVFKTRGEVILAQFITTCWKAKEVNFTKNRALFFRKETALSLDATRACFKCFH